MGLMGAAVGGTLLGLGAAAALAKKPKYSMPTSVHSNMAVTQPETPAAPTAVAETGVEQSRTRNPEMENARERERQAALLRQQQAPELFTSGLGASGLAETAKKTLLGG